MLRDQLTPEVATTPTNFYIIFPRFTTLIKINHEQSELFQKTENSDLFPIMNEPTSMNLTLDMME